MSLLSACGAEIELPPTLIPTAAPVLTFTPRPADTATPRHTPTPIPTTAVPTATPVVQYPTETPLPTATPPPTATSVVLGLEMEIGRSVGERPLTAYQFKNGPDQVVIVGGIHGGYEWNTIALAYEAIEYFKANPDTIPDSVTLNIIPSANPDGLAFVAKLLDEETYEDIGEVPLEETLPGRFNDNEVDLNRNWDCEWHTSAYWRDQWVSGGKEPFSEPETQALRDFLLEKSPAVVVFLHSAANGVFASGCGETFKLSLEAAKIYGLAAGYPIHERFDAYIVTGDAADWLAEEGVPAFSVELKDHSNLDWQENLAGMRALLAAFAE